MRALKNVVTAVVRGAGYELCQLYEEERREVPSDVPLTYKEAQCFRAMSNMGQLSITESRLLSELVATSDASRPIIEIGTLFGFSTTVMTLAKHPAQRLITVDNYSWNPLGLSPEAHYRTTTNRLKEAIQKFKVEIVRVDKDAFYRGYDGPPPAVFFCDADHSYEATKADLLWAKSIGATVICGDDYDHPYQIGTKQAVDELGGPRRLAGGLFVL